MQAKTDFDVVIIGGGIVGLASAFKLAQRHPGLRLAVVEKEDRLAAHQTGHNSGVIHSGLYYKPGSSKAKTCTAGRRELIAFAERNGIAHEICGKIIVATEPKELPVLEKILENGRANGVEGIEKVGPERIAEIEPAAAGIAALWVPSAGIIDFPAVVERLAELVTLDHPQNKVFTGHRVTGFDKHDFYTNVVTNQGSISTRYVINCAGLQCDRIARMDRVDAGVRIVPFRGDYVELTPSAAEKVRNLIYPVPDPAFPFLGVHYTRMIGGGVECGPNAVFAFKREGYTKTAFSAADLWEALSYTGTWCLFLRHWAYGLGEYTRAFCRKLLLKQLQRLVPSVTLEDLRPGQSGVRAQAVGPKGQLVDDFLIETTKTAIHVLNAPSPAATASLAIGEYIHQVATEQFRL